MVHVHELLYDDHFYFIVSDLMAHGNLLDYIVYRRKNYLGPMAESDVKFIARQLFRFLEYLHG